MADVTKTNLTDAIHSLVLKKPLSKITIGELSSEARVNRQTFYYHFHDLVDLLAYVAREEIDDLVNNEDFGYVFEDDLRHILEIAAKDDSVVLNSFRYLETETTSTVVMQIVHPLVLRYVTDGTVGLKVNDDQVNSCIRFWDIALKGVVNQYLATYHKVDLNWYAHRVAVMLKGISRRTLINLMNEKSK